MSSSTFGVVGDAGERRVVAIQRHVLDRPVIRLGVDGIDGGDAVRAGKAAPLVALHAQPDNDARASRHASQPKLTLLFDDVELAVHVVGRDRNVAVAVRIRRPPP